MSSLRLALKQSLQESGGGSFSLGHGDKKKRKKKKNGGLGSNGNGNSSRKGKRDGDSGAKRKRGRPRKHPKDHDDDDPNLTKSSKHDVGDDDDDDEFYSDQGSSFAEDESDDEDDQSDDDDDIDDEDDDDDSNFRSRTKGRDESLKDEEDETMHSDEDDQPKGNGAPKISGIASDSKKEAKASDGQHLEPGKPYGSDAKKSTSFPSDPPDALKSAPNDSSETSMAPNAAANADDEMRKKLKILKLKKKNSAASKIQSEWKKKKVDVSPSSSQPKGPSGSTNISNSSKEKIPTDKSDSGSASLNVATGAASKPISSETEQQQKTTLEKNKSEADGADSKAQTTTRDNSSNSFTTKSPSKSNNAAGDGDKTVDKNDDEEQPVPAKKKKKKNKNKNNGIVPAPTREVKQWSLNMSVKKARKHIQVGMRVKVRFVTNVKRDGKLVKKKKFYGGKITEVSKKCTKVRIKYDDGTSEVSKFPDEDVIVDAVDNGEHEVSADKFIPPPQEEDDEIPDGEEEGEIPKTPKAAVVAETEEGEVEEEAKPPALSSQQKSTDKVKNQSTRDSVDDATGSVKVSMDKTSIESPSMSKKETSTAQIESSKSLTPHEEGELSPGIKVSKNDEDHSRQHQDEPKTLPSAALVSSNISKEKSTTEPIKFAADSITPTGGTNIGDDESNEKESKVLPKPKKLSIRIPSDSLASIKGMSSPKSAGGAKSPKIVLSSSKIAAAVQANDGLVDTTDTNNSTAKRKRETDDVASSHDATTGEEPPTKRRIKVANVKNLLEAKPEDVESISDAKAMANEETKVGLMEDKLAPTADVPVSAVEPKKKKKKADRAKSPRPKSPLPILESEKGKVNVADSSSVTPKQQKLGSKGTETEPISKEEGIVEPKETTLKASISAELLGASASLRTGRKAAEEAKEKLSVKQKGKLNAKEAKEKESGPPESGKKKKKRRRENENDEHGEEESELEQSELEWVQCDACKKWRVLPDNIKAASLPDLWYCHMNVYDPKRNKCEAPEQNMKQLLRERKKRARKRAKREAELAEMQEEKAAKKNKEQEEDTSSSKKKNKQDKLNAAGSATPRSTSPKTTPKTTKSTKASGGKSKESINETKKAVADAKKSSIEGKKKGKGVSEDQPNPTDSGSDTQKDAKKKSKKGKKDSQENADNQDAEDSKKSGRKRGRPSRNQSSSTTAASSANDDGDEDNVEWVQCDKCEKWRKLPPHISADELPDVWNCSMNTWNPDSASCSAVEDKADAHHQEVGASEWQLRQLHAGKYSYRQMIFGTGARKHNRPLSERARAAESLFVQAVADEDQAYPMTQYTKSSAFVPKVSNFSKNLTVEENTIGIFDILKHSTLWEDLKTMDMQPSKVLSSSTSALNIPGQKIKTYECLSDEIKHAMQDVVLQTLEFGCLTGDEIIGKTQWFRFDTSTKAGIRGYCNEDIIIHTLLDLVRDGLVEIATVRDPFLSVEQWVPRYRRVGTRRAIEAVEAIKKSRCMKIAKPWKYRPADSTETEWVAGQQFN